jgi:hypothetical protein
MFAADLVDVLLFVLFQVPLVSCASTWRAGETKNGAYQKLKSLIHWLQNSPFRLNCYMYMVIIPDDIFIGLHKF